MYYSRSAMDTTYTSTPVGPVESVVDPAEFSDLIGSDVSDPVLEMVSVMATAAVIEYLQSELISRARVVTYQSWPFTGTEGMTSLSRGDAAASRLIGLPYARLISAESVSVYGETVTGFESLNTKPASLDIGYSYTSSEGPAIVVEYTAGYGEIADVPKEIRLATMMLAAFLYEHRGSCDAQDAIGRSGAGSMLYPYRISPVSL